MQTGLKLDEIIERLRTAQKELETELEKNLAEKSEQFRYRLQHGKVVFEERMHQDLKKYRIRLWQYLRQTPILYILSAPLIYFMVIPIFFLDVTITIYQHICFRIYKIPRVVRSDFFTIDRGQLSYLNAIEKLNCVYCGYGNGLIEYAREIIARTEQYWCPIKHAQRVLRQHDRVQKYFDYGDANEYRENLEKIRKDW